MKYGKQIRKIAALSEAFGVQDWVPYKKLKQIIKDSSTSPEEFLQVLTESILKAEKKFLRVQETIEKEAEEEEKELKEEELAQFSSVNKTAIRKITKKYRKKRGISLHEEVQNVLEKTIFGGRDPQENKKITLTPKGSQSKKSSLNCSAKEFVPSFSCTSKLNANAKSFVFSPEAPSFTPSNSSANLSADAAVFVPKSSKPDPLLGITESLGAETPTDEPMLHPLQMRHPTQDVMQGCGDLNQRQYSVDWLLQQRLHRENIGPNPGVPQDITFPLHCRKEIISQTPSAYPDASPLSTDPDSGLVNWDQLSHLVSPTFEDEIRPEDRCDTFHRVYGADFLRQVSGRYTEIHQDILHKPELISENTKQNVYLQLLQNLTASGMMPPMPMNPMMAAPHLNPLMNAGPMGIPPMGMMPPHLLLQMISAGPDGLSAMFAFPPNFMPPDEESDVEEKNKNNNNGNKAKKKKPNKKKATPPSSPTKKRLESSSSAKNNKNNGGQNSGLLHKTKNAWSRKAVITNEEDLAARTMQALLNKLVPEKFDKLLKVALTDITVTKETTLNEITVRLHKKAISEAEYAPLYTHFVRKLKQNNFKSFKSTTEELTIESLLFDLCLARLDAEYEPESEDLDDECRKGLFWKETLGNYTLLGELYKREIASHQKIVSIIVTLLGTVKNPNDDCVERGRRVEQLFHLLKSCGTDFEERCRKNNHLNKISAQEPTFLDQCFQDLAKISKDNSLQKRTKFMLQDLIDLKNKHWEHRNNSGMCPKFLSEIKEDIRKERIQWSRHVTRMSRSNNHNKRRKAHTPRPKATLRRKLWSAPRSNSDSNLLRKPVAKARSPKIDKVQWAKIVKGQLSQNSTPPNRPDEPVIVNAWSKGRPNIRESRSPSLDSSSSKAATEITTLSGMTGTSGSVISRDSSEGAGNITPLSEEIDDHLFEDAVLELFESNDLDNACLCIKEAIEQGFLQERFIFSAINASIEKDEKRRNLLDKLFITLFKSESCSPEAFVSGLKLVLEFLSDWYIDVPHLPGIMSKWLSSWLQNDVCEFETLKNLDENNCKVWSKVIQNLEGFSSTQSSNQVPPIIISGVETEC